MFRRRTLNVLLIQFAFCICVFDLILCDCAGADLVLLGTPEITAEFHGQDRPLVLPRSRYMIRSQGDRFGTTVQWTAGPFVHENDRRFSVDSRIQIATVGARRNGPVAILISQDETHVAQGDQKAAVSAAIIRPGNAGIEMQVMFLATDASTLASGRYFTRVVGTVTGN